ncbi:MAG: cysteine desulfurase [Bacteroidetes bacterium]|nr:cysteine desulfurase [Bacteroidota bacterium]
MLKRNVYLDHNATTPVASSVRKTMNRVLKYYWGNPSTGYQKGKNAQQIIEKARDQVAQSINAHAHEIYFTSCATESNNSILKTLAQHFYPSKRKIITTPIEHSSVLKTLDYLKNQGIIVEFCSVDQNGFISISELEGLIDDDTFLVCCMLANNEIGTIQNLKEISEITKKRDILLMSDCVQAFGKIPIDVKELGLDYATFSAHKLYGPKGVGAIYAKISAPLSSFIHGGGQEEGIRGGTESVHNIAGFGKACQSVPDLLSHLQKTQTLRDHFLKLLKDIKSDIVVNSPLDNGLMNTLNISFPGIKSKELMMMLDYHGISVSSGSACSTHSPKPSHVLKAIGLNDQQIFETVRISFGINTTISDLNYTIKTIKKFISDTQLNSQ